MTRRRLLKRLGVGAALLGAGTAGWLGLEPWLARVRAVEVRLADLPPALEGLSITQLSDLHRGPWVPTALLRHGVEMANSLGSDLVVLTGDFLSVHRSYATSVLELVSQLQAPLGVFAVLGNHDYWVRGQENLARGFSRLGITLLVNQATRLVTRGENWWMVGVDDCWAGSPDLVTALKGVPPGEFRLLLAHEPDFADNAVGSGISLQLSGHSHGGQVRLPGLGAIHLPPYGRKYPMGLQSVEGSRMQVYTNVGIGVVAPPVRLGCPPEVTRITLRRAQSEVS